MSCKAKIIGTGSYLPEKILSNFDLEKMVDTSDEWIVTRTGMKERRIAASDEYASHMGAEAARRALQDANLDAKDIDFILVATITPDYVFPSTACLIQEQIGAINAAGLDIQGACTGFLYGLSIAKAMIEAKTYKNILVIASEKLSSITNYKDRTTCVLFGDGAGAAVVSGNGKGLGIGHITLGSDGQQAELLMMPGGGSRNPSSIQSIENELHYIKMAGNEVFKHAVRRMESACKECLEASKVSESEVTYLIPHQANMRIIDAIAKRFEHLPKDRIFKTVQKYGNTAASSVAIALDELCKTSEIHANDQILLTAFGGGFTWGSALLKGEP